MIISVIGLGYIGLPTAVIIASKKIKVIGVDNNKNVVNSINNGTINIPEPDLKAVSKVQPSDVYIICVPTPIKKNKTPDISFIKSAIMEIAPILKKRDMIILESTSPVGTTEKISKWITIKRKNLNLSFSSKYKKKKITDDFFIAYCPERVLPGNIMSELIFNMRVIGGINKRSSIEARKFYKKFVKAKVEITSCRIAEMSKLTENAYRDVNIAFANELSILSDKLNIDVWELIKLSNLHPRVNILNPGPGVGGHCIAVDPWFIVHDNPSYSKLIKKAREVNDYKTKYLINLIKKTYKRLYKKNKNISASCFGITYKANSDDLRESPSLKIVQSLAKIGFNDIKICDPFVKKLPIDLNPDKYSMTNISQSFKSDLLIFLVGHNTFTNLKNRNFKDKKIIDTIGLIS